MKRVVSLLLAAGVVGAIGCRERAPAAGSGPYAQEVADDIPKIEQAVGVKFKTPPKLEERSRDEVREFLLAKTKEPDEQRRMVNEEAMLKVLGLIPDTMHLADFTVRLLTEQVVGYYDPKTKVLYVVKGAPDDEVGITIMHELVHALQDQYVNLDSLLHIEGDEDRATAAQAVIEGQATYEQMYIMVGAGGNIAAQLPGGWESMRETIRDAARTQPVFSSAPMVIQEEMLFPYINGADFVRRFQARYPGRLPLDSLPVSTEQVMHNEAYFGKTRDVPSDIELPNITGAFDHDDLGEFGTRLFLYKHTNDQQGSIRASNGWDGDRYALVKTPGGDAFVWVTVWDTPTDGAEFVSALDQVMHERYSVAPSVKGTRRHYEARARTVDVEVRDVGGRPVVLYTDVPKGVDPATLIDFSKVKVTPK